MRPSAPPFLRRSLAAAALLALAACSDRRAATLPVQPLPSPPAGAAVLQCTVQVGAGTLACAPRTGGAGGSSAVILGGQGINVRLASAGTVYDAVSSILSTKVTVENLTTQVLGTADGATPSAAGVRVFFASPPTVTAGTGTVSLANADGEGVFTGAAQSYFQYAGMLFPGDATPAREWRFSLPITVTAFVFTVYVAAPVANEGGWVGVQPAGPSMAVGDTMHLSATVRAATGRPVAGAGVTWTTSHPARATVDSLGVVTALDTGWVDVTATSGTRTGRVSVRVDPAGTLYPRPTIVAFDVLTPSVEANGYDSVRMRVTMRGFTGAAMNVLFARGSTQGACGGSLAHTESDGDGVYECSVVFGESFTGVWQVTEVIAPGLVERRMSTAGLRAAGAPTVVNLRVPVDTTAPELTDVSLPDTIRAGIDSVEVMAWMTDRGRGALRFTARFSHPGGNERFACVGTLYAGTPHAGLFRCGNWLVPSYTRSGPWIIDSIEVSDIAGNKRLMRTAELEAAGLRTSFFVTNPDPDLTPPTITAFSFTPNVVKGDGADSVRLTLSADDARSRVWSLDMEFEKAGSSQTRRCLLNVAPQPSPTMTCAQRFTADDAGPWQVRYVRAIDQAGNERVLYTDDLRAASYPADLAVTP